MKTPIPQQSDNDEYIEIIAHEWAETGARITGAQTGIDKPNQQLLHQQQLRLLLERALDELTTIDTQKDILEEMADNELHFGSSKRAKEALSRTAELNERQKTLITLIKTYRDLIEKVELAPFFPHGQRIVEVKSGGEDDEISL